MDTAVKEFHKMEEVIWDNDFVRITYLGVFKGDNFWGIKFIIENKTDDKISIEISDIDMNGYIIDIFPYIGFDFLANSKTIKHVSIAFEELWKLKINSIKEMNNFKLKLFCKKNNKTISESSLLNIHIIDYLKEIHNYMFDLMLDINKGIIWNAIDENMPLSISFDFPYPNGKHGDIDMYLISKYGIYKQVTPTTYSGTLSTEHLHIIELMVLFYYTKFSQNALLVNRKNNENVLLFLKKYNNIMKLYDIYKNAEIDMNRRDILNNPVMQSGYYIMRDKYLELKNERNSIYQDIMVTKVTSSRWKSEQQLYTLVKSIYTDAVYQYQDDWLERLSLDIYIPSLKIAIEYQGIQHYKPVDYFGGEERLEIQKNRDKKKKILCARNGIKIINWKYDILPSLENLNKMLESVNK